MLTPNIHAYTQNREIDYENSVSSSKPLGGFINTYQDNQDYSENDKAIAKAILATASTGSTETPELWLTIEGFPDYEVSNQGRVKSHKGSSPLILQASDNSKGYLFVNLCYKGKVTRSSLHRLTALAFIPNPNNLPEVNHIDEDKTNNNVWNLEWCTTEYNGIYSVGKTATLLSPDGILHTFTGIAKFCREHDLNQSIICQMLKGKYKTCKGWTAPGVIFIGRKQQRNKYKGGTIL